MSPELNEQARAVVRRLEARVQPPTHAQSAASARRSFRERTEQLAEGPAVDTVTDVSIPGPEGAGEVPIRLYAHGAGEDRPVLLWFHGGGWVLGDLETHDHVCRELAHRTGWLVLSVGYRLAPEHPFPAALDDAYAATRWAATHAGTVGGDPDRLLTVGASAGGNLAAAVALRARDEGEPSLSGQVLVYPAVDPSGGTDSHREFADGPLLTREGVAWYWEQYLGHPIDGRHPYAAPARARSLGGVAPAVVLTCGFDPLRDEGRAYADRLEGEGVPVERLHYDDVMHGFLTMSGAIDRAAEAHADLAVALERLVD
jgi:acetyl esterase